MLKLRKLISYLLLAISLQWIIPHELVHSLCNHHDTVDHVNPTDRLSFGNQHEHCLILELSVPPMSHDEFFVVFIAKSKKYFYEEFLLLPIVFPVHETFECRGPPALLI